MPDLVVRTAIASFLREYTDDGEVLKLLVASLGRVLAKTADRGGEWRGLVSPADVIHITDWLTAARINEMPWLRKLDDRGRPVKLAKFGTVEQIKNEADKAMRRMASGMATGLEPGDEIDVMDLDDGYKVVRLMTPKALDLESARMQHCIGQGGYDPYLERPELGVHFFSLRDRAGNPHVTLEADNDGELHQMQGKQNKPPLEKYVNRLLPFFKERGIAKTRPSSGYVFDDTARLRLVAALPDGIVIPGDLEINHTSGLAFPRKLTVLGNMSIMDTVNVQMPEELRVGGHLKMFSCRQFSPVGKLAVTGSLIVNMCTIDRLAKDITAASLSMSCNLLGIIADTASVPGDVDIEGGGGYIGDDYKGLRDIDCLRHVGGALVLRKCSVAHLPEGLTVGGSLRVVRGRFERLPVGMKVGGDISITWSDLEELPPRFTCNGDLTLTSSRVTAIPAGAWIAGSLDIANTSIAGLPDDIFIGGSLRASYSQISRLPDTLKVIDGTLDICGTMISALPTGLHITVDLLSRNSALQDIPDDVTVGRLVVVDETARSAPANRMSF
jgi:hypothetical protein|nr:PcfJ domain-containing protein [Neorhizobium tomejilense]